jgi:antitoxin component YwqK of YwqJK toxin-antitoxin module
MEIFITAVATVLLLTVLNWFFSISELIQFIIFKKNNPDKEEGIFKTFYENGNIKSEQNYLNWKFNGKWKIFYENGNIKSENNYQEGKLNGESKEFYENGNIKSENNYQDDKLNGESKEFFQDGNIMSLKNYLNNRTDGTQIEWYNNGQIKRQVKTSSLGSETKCWNENGEQVKCK